MNKILKNALIVCLSLLLLPACESEGLGNIASTDEEEVNLIPCKLKYTVADMVAGTAESKALTRSDMDADGIYSNIENVMVVQFNGDDETSTVSRVDYITNLLDPEIMLVETNVRTIVLFLANTFDDNCVSVGQTLAEVKKLGIALSGNITETTNGIIYDESLVRANEEGRLHFISSDCKIYEYGIQSGEDIEINLQRNVSRIKLTISNGWEGQILKSVGIVGIPTTYLYYANRASEIETPIVPETVGSTTSYSQTIETVGGTEENPEVTELTFYVPVNMRGYDEESTAATKPDSDCATGATYARVAFSYRTDMTSEDYGSAIFKLYLGSDLEKDFNLKPTPTMPTILHLQVRV